MLWTFVSSTSGRRMRSYYILLFILFTLVYPYGLERRTRSDGPKRSSRSISTVSVDISSNPGLANSEVQSLPTSTKAGNSSSKSKTPKRQYAKARLIPTAEQRESNNRQKRERRKDPEQRKIVNQIKRDWRARRKSEALLENHHAKKTTGAAVNNQASKRKQPEPAAGQDTEPLSNNRSTRSATRAKAQRLSPVSNESYNSPTTSDYRPSPGHSPAVILTPSRRSTRSATRAAELKQIDPSHDLGDVPRSSAKRLSPQARESTPPIRDLYKAWKDDVV